MKALSAVAWQPFLQVTMIFLSGMKKNLKLCLAECEKNIYFY